MPEESLLATDVADELRTEPAIHADRLSVAVSDGTIVLAGNVDSYREKDLAEHAALRVRGVRAVANEITVEVPATQQRSDQEIAEAAAWTLRWNAAVPEEAVQLTVDDGWVTLYGSVAWQFERLAAEGAICDLMGVRGITNGEWSSIASSGAARFPRASAPPRPQPRHCVRSRCGSAPI